ncbi:hypothetical protein APY03_7761 [Variovorax sp. WDL1]|nr:hypothetical protein APY03_7761 [Variovorax sp. WDL1]
MKEGEFALAGAVTGKLGSERLFWPITSTGAVARVQPKNQ